MFSTERKIILGYLLIGAFQMVGHWYLSTHGQLAQKLLADYLYRDPQSGKGASGHFDLTFPGIVCGLLTGWVGSQLTFRRLLLLVFFASLGVCALNPMYTLVLDRRLMWWWPTTGAIPFLALFVQFMKGFALVGFFTYVGQGFRTYCDQREVETSHQVPPGPSN